jgi:hypothetical protein
VQPNTSLSRIARLSVSGYVASANLSDKNISVSFAKDKAFHWALIAQPFALVISVRGYVVDE